VEDSSVKTVNGISVRGIGVDSLELLLEAGESVDLVLSVDPIVSEDVEESEELVSLVDSEEPVSSED
jgi:hypothetical protein